MGNPQARKDPWNLLRAAFVNMDRRGWRGLEKAELRIMG